MEEFSISGSSNSFVLSYANGNSCQTSPAASPPACACDFTSGGFDFTCNGGWNYFITGDSNGNLRTTQINKVQKISTAPAFVQKFSVGTPWGIALDSSGNLWVPDYFDNYVQEYTSSGTLLKTTGSSGSGSGQFRNPVGIAIDR